MNFPLFITRRIALSSSGSFSRFIIRLAIVAVALSIAVMIITTAVVNGFQQEISRKTFAFWGHIHVTALDLNPSQGDTHPISLQQNFYPSLEQEEGYAHIQMFARKAGIAKTDTDIEGLMLKGVGKDFDWKNFQDFLLEGQSLGLSDSTASNDIIISKSTANRLRLKVGDKLTIYFVEKPPRVRRFTICGIYNTGLAEYDQQYAMIDIRQIQRLNEWSNTDIGGFEIFIDDVDRLDELTNKLYYSIPNKLSAQSMKEINPNLFQWLDLQNTNEQVILVLMIIMAIINMVTTLLILILERTNMIGILKALGGTNFDIQTIFIFNALYIVLLGVLLGNVLGLGVCLLQKHFQIITLEPESYYLSVAPIAVNWVALALINVGTLIICFAALVLPSFLVARISPIKAIQFK